LYSTRTCAEPRRDQPDEAKLYAVDGVDLPYGKRFDVAFVLKRCEEPLAFFADQIIFRAAISMIGVA
jgi:glutamate racemase